jgi:hypothetical protein
MHGHVNVKFERKTDGLLHKSKFVYKMFADRSEGCTFVRS